MALNFGSFRSLIKYRRNYKNLTYLDVSSDVFIPTSREAEIFFHNRFSTHFSHRLSPDPDIIKSSGISPVRTLLNSVSKFCWAFESMLKVYFVFGAKVDFFLITKYFSTSIFSWNKRQKTPSESRRLAGIQSNKSNR